MVIAVSQNEVMKLQGVIFLWLPLGRVSKKDKRERVWCEDTADLTGVEHEVYVEDVTDLIKRAKNHYVVNEMTVTTTAGNEFDANLEARQNMADGILASTTLGLTQTTWRLADNTEVLIDIAELKEAQALAIQRYAEIKGIK